MTCDETEPELLAARTAADLPDPVRAHVRACPRCAAASAALLALGRATAALVPPDRGAGRERLHARLRAAPRPAAPSTRARRFAPWALAAAVLVAGGWLAVRFAAPQPNVPLPQPDAPTAARPVAPMPLPAPGVLVRVARHAARAAGTADPDIHLDALHQIAADVRREAVRRATAGDADAVPALVGVHSRVLKHGISRQVRRAPDPRRAAADTERALSAAATELSATADELPPAVGDALRPMARDCRAPLSAPAGGAWPASDAPLDALAAHAARVCAADTPLARADEAAQLAAALAQTVSVLAVTALPDDAGRAGDALGLVLTDGVALNLERAEAANPTAATREQVAGVRARAARATEVLERNLAKAPPAARAGLERALTASGPGSARAAGKTPPGKGWGAPWKKDGEHPGKGWQKKQ